MPEISGWLKQDSSTMKDKILQLNRFACAAGIVLLMAGGVNADLVLDFSGANAQVATVSVGTLGVITEPADNSAITSLSYTVSGLTIDTDGVDNDTVTFTIPLSPVGAGPINWDTNGVDGIREFDFDGGTFANGEGITFGNISVSGTGSGGLGYQLNSAVFTEFTVRRFGPTETYSLAGDVTTNSAVGSAAVALNDSFFTATSTGDTWNATDVDFTVDISSIAIPEPSTISMLGLGIVGLFARRRRI